MSRHFDGASQITLSPGALTTQGGPTTVVVLWRSAMGLVNGTIFEARSPAGLVASFRPHANWIFFVAYGGDFDFADAEPVSDGAWRIDAWTKAAGVSTVRYHWTELVGGSWVHADCTVPLGDSASSVSTLIIGNGNALGYAIGDVAAIMVVERVMTDGEIEALTTGLAAWYSSIGASIAGLWALNQSVITDPVVDLTGGGADQSGIVGTSIAMDPPGWSYDLMIPTADVDAQLPAIGGALGADASSSGAFAAVLPAMGSHWIIGANVPPPLMTGTAVVRGLTGAAVAA